MERSAQWESLTGHQQPLPEKANQFFRTDRPVCAWCAGIMKSHDTCRLIRIYPIARLRFRIAVNERTTSGLTIRPLGRRHILHYEFSDRDLCLWAMMAVVMTRPGEANSHKRPRSSFHLRRNTVFCQTRHEPTNVFYDSRCIF